MGLDGVFGETHTRTHAHARTHIRAFIDVSLFSFVTILITD